MATSRRHTNGRSPLVNQQRQITSFFSKSTSSSSSSPSNPNQKLNISDGNPTLTPSPATPSPTNHKSSKPLLLIGASSLPSPSPSPFCSSSGDKQPNGQELVGRRIKVYWPLDKAWYEGCVKSFDEVTGKHLVRYDDDEEEILDIAKEKIEWVQETTKKLKRLRRHGFPAIRKMVIEEDDGAENEEGKVDKSRCGGSGDANSCEDWMKKEVVEEAEEDEEYMKLEKEKDEEDIAKGPNGKRGGKVEPGKRKIEGQENLGPAKKSKSGGEVGKGGFKVLSSDPTSNLEGK